MKTPLLVFLLLALLQLGLHAASTPVPPSEEKGVTVTLVSDKNVIMLGEPIYVSVTVKNHSARSYGELLGFSLSAQGVDGSKVENPTFGLSREFVDDTPSLEIGSERTERISLADNAVFTKPGDYVLTASASAADGPGGKSISPHATAKITVIPADETKMLAVIDDLTARMTPVGDWNAGQEEARDKLAKIGGSHVLGWCMKAIASDNADAQTSAISIMARQGRDMGSDILKAAMDNTLKDPDYQSAHARGDNYLMPRARIAYIDYLRSSIAQYDQAARGRKLQSGAGLSPVIPYLLSLAKHPDPAVRFAVMKAIPYQIPAPQAHPTVREHAQDKDENVRSRAQYLLKDLQDQGAR